VVVLGEESGDFLVDDGEGFVDGEGVLQEVTPGVDVEFALLNEAAHRFDGVRVDDDFLQPSAGDVDVVYESVDEFEGFGSEPVP